MCEVKNMGNFNIARDAPRYEINKDEALDLFYMRGIKQQTEQGGSVSVMGWIHLFVFLARKRPLQAFNPHYVFNLVKKTRTIYGKLPKWRDPFAKFFHEDSLWYFNHLVGFESQPYDLRQDFVYFPLQLQPEMTTSALGGRFRDQAYAIERLQLSCLER